MKTENLAILLTDIAGYTAATARQTREENAAWLDTHARLLKPAFAAFGGTVIKEIGDAFLCTFRSPTDAVLCGTALLDRLWAHNQSCPPLMRLNVRVVVNIGEVRVVKGDIIGEPVNVAARVEDVAEGGEVTLTEGVFLTMARSEVELESLGPHRLKGIPEPVTLYRVKQLAPRPAAGELHATYPYGGTQLHRLQAVPSGSGKLEPARGGEAVEQARAGLAAASDAAARAVDALHRVGGGRFVGRVAAAGVVLALLGVAAWGGVRMLNTWRNDPFAALEDRLAAGDHKGAGAAWDRLEQQKVGPEWKLNYYLGRISSVEGECADMLQAYRDALKEHADLSTDEKLNDDVVSCLAGPESGPAKLIRNKLGKAAAPALARLAKDNTEEAEARLTSLGLLESMGELGRVEQREVLLQVLNGDHPCPDRREAVIKLASLKDPDALPALRAAQVESDPTTGKRAKQNRCLVGALGEAIRATEEAN
ncbi:MAG: adenylate/guanylate cyclase domain-containing protein [Myxococcota bacterium]